MIPTDEQINAAIEKINGKYQNHPEFQIKDIVCHRTESSVIIESHSPHHVANTYDLGLEIGGSVEYGSIEGGSFVKFTLS